MVRRCKKKVDTELAIFFPTQFGADLNHLDRIREYNALLIKQALGEDVTLQIRAVENYFVEKQKPWVFNPYEEDCILVTNDRTFEEVCAGMEDSGISNPKELSAFEFYSKIAYLNKKAEKINSKL